MSAEDETGAGRMDVLIDRATRVVRLLAWIAMFALCCLMLWWLGGTVTRADDPRTAARAIGNAGQAAAGAIARDAASAGEVPGYAGTDVPERRLTATGMADAAQRVLSDPDDAGGDAGRTLVHGTTSRPERPVSASDPAVRRGKLLAANPRAPAHGADGLASGSVTECEAEVGDAESGGACGRVTWCVGADCESVAPESNTGFVEAASRLNMALEMGGDEFDRDDLRFFTGQRRACTIRWGGLANCCRNSGLLVGLANCSSEERKLAQERHDGNTRYLGTRCARRTFFGICIKRERVWCVFGSKLGRILQEQGRRQLGIGWGSCRGLTVAEVERIDFERLDLTEFTENLMEGAREPAVSLPGTGDTQAAMRERIRDFYRRRE